jgi:hypothetical protein
MAKTSRVASLLLLACLLACVANTYAGPVFYGICQTGERGA